jgi:hypothetical protein
MPGDKEKLLVKRINKIITGLYININITGKAMKRY